MQRTVSRRVLFVGIAIVLATGVSCSASTKTTPAKTRTAKTSTTKSKTAQKPTTGKPRTVVDYFMLLPQDYLDIPPSKRGTWLYGENSRGSIVDIKNDYIRMAGDETQWPIYMALFRYKGRVLLGVCIVADDWTSFGLLRYENGRWKDVTTAMLPVPYNETYQYVIPRYGTTIKVTTGNGVEHPSKYGHGTKVYDLVWTQGKFKVRRG